MQEPQQHDPQPQAAGTNLAVGIAIGAALAILVWLIDLRRRGE